jgi:hypothetical protein
MAASTSPTPGSKYEDHDRHVRHEDIAMVTAHYRGAHAGLGLQPTR